MVRTSILLSLLAILIGSLLYFRVPPASILRTKQFVGIANCRGCHGTQAIGDQYGRWEASAHARGFTALRSDSAVRYAAGRGIAQPDSNPACLRCHTTAFSAPQDMIAADFHREDGVTCEECHGAGSDYSPYAAMRDRRVFARLGGRVGSTHDCLTCHAEALSPDACPFQHEPFVAAVAMRRIAHALPRKTAVQ